MVTPKFYLLSFLFLIFYCSLHAQDTTNTHRNELAIDVSPVFAGILSRNAIPGITYRRHYNQGALRARLNLGGGNSEYSNVSSSANSNIPARETKNTDVSLRVGYQWHKNYNKFRWYYGIDVLAAYSEYHDLSSTTNVDQQGMTTYTNTNDSKGKSKEFGISPLIGLSYKITNRFSVSVESALLLSRTLGKVYYSSKSFYPSNTPQIFESSSSNKTTGTNYSFIPMNGLLVSYHF